MKLNMWSFVKSVINSTVHPHKCVNQVLSLFFEIYHLYCNTTDLFSSGLLPVFFKSNLHLSCFTKYSGTFKVKHNLFWRVSLPSRIENRTGTSTFNFTDTINLDCAFHILYGFVFSFLSFCYTAAKQILLGSIEVK